MGCAGCSSDKGGTPRGCGDNGHCSSGGCNKMNTYDWLSNLDLQDPTDYNLVEVSFKNGARKDFFHKNQYVQAITGDLVAVEAGNGYDIGQITLSGELVRLQMRKKHVKEDRVLHKVLRIANQRDKDRLADARSNERPAMIKARAIARTLDLDMKVGDVEYQGDNRKATFYYTADGRVDFRELVRAYANEFRIKIEMRQIGSRQESARIGGLGPCGRELCCSTWLSDFKSVSTSAARYQNLAINQTKLSGQCGRLKCCLNYELDSYIDALQSFPKRAERLKTAYHRYELVKTDIFKGLMYYIQLMERGRGPIIAIHKDRVREIIELNKNKEFPEELGASAYANVAQEEDDQDYDFEDGTGQIELPEIAKKRRSSRNKRRSSRGGSKNRGNQSRRSTSGRSSGGRSKSKGGDSNRDAAKKRPQGRTDTKSTRDGKKDVRSDQKRDNRGKNKKKSSSQSRQNKNRNRPPRSKSDD